MGYYSQNTVAQEGNIFTTGGLVGAVNNSIFTLTCIVAPSSIRFNFEQSIDVGPAQAKNNFFDENNFYLHHVTQVQSLFFT